MEALLKDKSAPHSRSYSLYQVLTLTARPTRRLFWKTERSWWSLRQPISCPHPDG